MKTVLDIRDLEVRFATTDGEVAAVNGISLNVKPGECLGIVGESGSGKSQTFMAAMGLLAENGHTKGEIRYHEQDLLGLDVSTLNTLRGNKLGMIFQDPMTALTPHMKIGRQLAEVLELHRGMTASESRIAVLEMLDRVHIPEPEKRLGMYPHELSGGLRQRIMIAMALLCEPELIIADEPTTALDVTVQAQILDLFRSIKEELNTGIVLITHDLGVIAGVADRVAVMYGGRIVEEGPVDDLFAHPRHPYTLGLLNSMPRLDEAKGETLNAIPGQPPNLQNLPQGCAFHPRCSFVQEKCLKEVPVLHELVPGRCKACHVDIKEGAQI